MLQLFYFHIFMNQLPLPCFDTFGDFGVFVRQFSLKKKKRTEKKNFIDTFCNFSTSPQLTNSGRLL